MKNIIFLCLSLLIGSVVLTACSKAAATPPSTTISASQSIPASKTEEDSNMEHIVYRGRVEEITETSLTVAQILPGYQYGQERIVFHLNDDTETSAERFEPDSFVEVYYSGVLTRSMPAQGNAEKVNLIFQESDNILLNGVIQTVTIDKEQYVVSILPDSVKKDTSAAGSNVEATTSVTDTIILIVPKDALEGGLTEADLAAGTPVSAVSRGIMTNSLPPQVPVLALLPLNS